MVFTSGLMTESTRAAAHSVELQASGHVRNLRLYDRPGDDARRHKGDLWTFSMLDFGIPNMCITIGDIRRVSIIEGSNDGWHIDSIVTIVKDLVGGYELLTRDFGANRWIDGNSNSTYRRFELTRN